EQPRETSLTLTLEGQASADYHNSYGYYVMDENGAPTTGVLVWADVHDLPVGSSVTIEGVDPSRIGFFLVPNGDGRNGGLHDGLEVTFQQAADGTWQAISTETGTALQADGGGAVLFDRPDLNVGGATQVVDNDLPGNQNWEDIRVNTGGDHDFNDVNITEFWEQSGT
ncbi:DUF4114 domain-containing protein, partial [Pararhodospirillum oryzae]|uniref:DUF4114 domain-containing protein n=1 Tax=Pararhodospirillum oryzae TaxID=478448 RepID=UPI0014780C63